MGLTNQIRQKDHKGPSQIWYLGHCDPKVFIIVSIFKSGIVKQRRAIARGGWEAAQLFALHRIEQDGRSEFDQSMV